jgi:hypothetical protein
VLPNFNQMPDQTPSSKRQSNPVVNEKDKTNSLKEYLGLPGK